MTKPALKLVKTKKRPVAKDRSGATEEQPPLPHLTFPTSDLQSSLLTSAERIEADRFRALTKQRAARQAKVRRIVAKLNELNNRVSNAA